VRGIARNDRRSLPEREIKIFGESAFTSNLTWGRGVKETLCLRSLATQEGSVNIRNAAIERLAKSNELDENLLHSVKVAGSSLSNLTMLE